MEGASLFGESEPSTSSESRTGKALSIIYTPRQRLDLEASGLTRVELLIIDDFALKAIDHTETADFYELIVERHHKAATIVTSNRDASEWIALMSDPLLAQSAVDRLVATSYEPVIEEEPYHRRQRPQHAAISGASD